MKIMQIALLATLVLTPQLSSAKAIKKDCLKAGRGTLSQCSCIQSVANRTLSNSQQRKGATFFKDPQKAQDTRQSSRSADNKMWDAWKKFGNVAAEQCN
ncbi:hypothetical protein RB2150_15261 [Rhodobacteraceae bacterium HTCC2150]|nr:hypothetical protein RB2150_15261 [Rhodobacteraceae bacterium HTCC2150]